MQQQELSMTVSLHRRVQDACSNTTYIWQYHYTDMCKMQQQKLPVTVVLHRCSNKICPWQCHCTDAATKVAYNYHCTEVCKVQQEKLNLWQALLWSWHTALFASVRCSINGLALGWNRSRHFPNHYSVMYTQSSLVVFCGNSQVCQFLVAWNG